MFINNSRQETQNKLKMLLTLFHFGGTSNKSALVDFLLDHEILEYFEINEMIFSLIESGLIDESQQNDSSSLSLTANGHIVLEFFKDRLPMDMQCTIEDLARLKAIREEVFDKTVEIDSQEDGKYMIKLTITKNGEVVTVFSTLRDTLDDASRIYEKLNTDAKILYNGIGKILDEL